MELTPKSDIRFLKGVGEKRAILFSKLSVYTVSDLLCLYPRAYEDLTVITPVKNAPYDEKCCIRAKVTFGPDVKISSGGTKVYTFSAKSDDVPFKIVIFNNVYAAKALKTGETYLFYGKVGGDFFIREMLSPEIFPDGQNTMHAVYPQTAGITSKSISRCIKNALDLLGDKITDPIPSHILKTYGLIDLKEALLKINFPENCNDIEVAKRRLIFGELLTFSLGMLTLRKSERAKTAVQMKDDYCTDFFKKLPFSPTGAQKRAAEEIAGDMKKDVPMRRLLQGDVGSGKTAVSACALYSAVKNGWQTAFMAPTEILAGQHFASLKKLIGDDMNIALLTGSLTVKQKNEIYRSLKEGKIDLLIGTHALIEQKVEFKKLGLCVTDEQHRFGVNQRATLTEKGRNPHLLVMSATPIPRSLSLIIYGDLDLSVLDEMPPGRTPIETYAVSSALHSRACNYVKKHLDVGKQGYIICPLVEEGENDAVASAEKTYEQLCKEDFVGYRLGLLHGKMKPKDKDAVMNDFASGKIQLLVATTVVEVGVDVPNAAIMIIENADRFGLSQLHQLRGRVGRGSFKSTCILISDAKSDNSKRRMEIMKNTCDGFKIADEDLKMRGPGDFFGSRQHGLPLFKIADLATDTELVKMSAKAAKDLIKTDPDLSDPVHRELKRKIQKLFDERAGGSIS